MKALLLSAGFGSRLGDITQGIPKVLVEVGGKSILDHSIIKLIEVGIKEIIINVHYFPEQIVSHLAMNDYPVKIKIEYEPILLGTGGTFLKHLEYLANEDFIVMHCDNYFEDPLSDFLLNHRKSTSNSLMTMFTFKTSNPENCGVITVDEDSQVLSFQEKDSSAKSNLANGAIYVFKPGIREFVTNSEFPINDISRDLLPQLVYRSTAYVSNGFFIDIGTPLTLAHAREMARKEIA